MIDKNQIVSVVAACILGVMIGLLMSCGTDRDDVPESDSLRSHQQYLESPVEPCAPLVGATTDPCERRFDDWEVVKSPYRSSSGPVIPDPPSIETTVSRLFRTPAYVPHLIARGVVKPGTTRCDEEDKIALGAYGYAVEVVEMPWDTCFSQFIVREYIVGRGPTLLTIEVGAHHKIGDYKDGGYYDWLEGIHSVFEGGEWVIALQIPTNFLYGVWRMNNYPWDVQKAHDGTVVVVDWRARYQSHLSRDENQFEVALDSFREIAARVHRQHMIAHGGRTGDFEGAPFLLDDANDEFILAHMSNSPVFSVVDATPQAPPPVPGEGETYTEGQNTLDETATASPEIPGGLEETETPGPLADDAATATATVEPTVTPEPAPTPEQVDTPTPESEVAPTATPEPAPTPEPDPTATATPESVVEPIATATPEPVIEPTATPEPVATATATPEPEPVVEPTATPEDAVVPTATPEPEVPVQEGPGTTEGPGGEGPEGPGAGAPGDNGPGAGPDG